MTGAPKGWGWRGCYANLPPKIAIIPKTCFLTQMLSKAFFGNAMGKLMFSMFFFTINMIRFTTQDCKTGLINHQCQPTSDKRWERWWRFSNIGVRLPIRLYPPPLSTPLTHDNGKSLQPKCPLLKHMKTMYNWKSFKRSTCIFEWYM